MSEGANRIRTGEGRGHSYRWDEHTWPEIRERAHQRAVVVVPVASTEQHGPHLPLCTDTLIVTAIADQAVAQARRVVPVLLAPTLFIGCSQHHMRFPGTLTLDEITFIDTATQLGLSIVSHGFRHLIFLNGHGGNRAGLEIAIGRIHAQTDALCALVNYWAFLRDIVEVERRSMPGGIGHACEFETAAVMALRPDLVSQELPSASCGKVDGYWSTDWYGDSPITLSFSVDEVSPSGVLGDPAPATAEVGTRWLNEAVARVTQFIVAFRGWSPEGLRAEGRHDG